MVFYLHNVLYNLIKLLQSNNLFMTFSAGLAPRLSGHNPTLILLSLWCLIVIVFIYAYIGILISFLTVPNLKPIISSLDDLPTSSLQWIARKGSAEGSLFMVGPIHCKYKTSNQFVFLLVIHS
jgi:hypothetical protein